MNRWVTMSVNRILMCFLTGFVFSSGIALAESPPPFPEFEAKRIKPPQKGTTKRIQVQIAPRANPAVAPEQTLPDAPKESQETTSAPAVSLYDWFWGSIDTTLDASGPGRLLDALELIATDQGRASLPSPRLQDLQDIAQRYGKEILLATVGTDVSPAFALSVIYTESSGNPAAISSAGAAGLMQLMPVTAERFNVADVMAPAENIRGGVQFLDVLMKEYNGDPVMVLAAYNAGQGAVRDHAGVPPYPETRNYVPKVLNTFALAKGLCTQPPLLVSDGCIFVAIAN